MLNWRQNTKKTKVELNSEVEKTSAAIFTEQGFSASQMTAAEIMDIISRLPGCDGQAADAVSAYIQEKWRMLTNYWKFQNWSVQTFGFVYHDTNGQNHGPASSTVFGWKCHWERVFWMKVSWMKLSSVLDEMALDKSVFGWKCSWMKVFLN